MYNLLIVDDESAIRKETERLELWEELGLEVIGTAENGMDALKYLNGNLVHVVVTDVRMPEMDGIEFIRQAIQFYPSIKFIVLSAYEDFTYAKEAMHYGAKGYLVKPLKEDEARKLIAPLVKELDKENESYNKVKKNKGLNVKAYGLPTYVREAVLYVNQHYDDKLTLKDISNMFYVTPSYFSVIFKKAVGMSFVDYVTQIKVEKSKHYLEKPIYKLKDIAYKVGYDDYSYFCKVFKKIEGITPLQYRSKVMNR